MPWGKRRFQRQQIIFDLRFNKLIHPITSRDYHQPGGSLPSALPVSLFLLRDLPKYRYSSACMNRMNPSRTSSMPYRTRRSKSSLSSRNRTNRVPR